MSWTISLRIYWAVLVCCLGQAASADIKPLGMSPWGQMYEAAIDYQSFEQNFNFQKETEWCWAASISNIFAFYGHPVSQEKIVSSVYRVPYNLPALAAIVVASRVNRAWTDDNGHSFHATLTAAYDFQAHVNAITNAYIVNELSNGRPLLICNTHHCMVLAAVDFIQTPLRPIVRKVFVFDPWPLSPSSYRPLEESDWTAIQLGGQMMFIGAIKVQ